MLRLWLLVGRGGQGTTAPLPEIGGATATLSEIRWGACLAVSTGGCRRG